MIIKNESQQGAQFNNLLKLMKDKKNENYCSIFILLQYISKQTVNSINAI